MYIVYVLDLNYPLFTSQPFTLLLICHKTERSGWVYANIVQSGSGEQCVNYVFLTDVMVKSPVFDKNFICLLMLLIVC